jgi:hypothetical protein
VKSTGLDGQVHLLDHAAQDRGVDLVLLEDLGDLVDVDFGHGWVLEKAKR